MTNMIERMFGLKGKVAVVTGAAGQLGGEYVKVLLAAGAAVAGLDIDPDNPKSRLKTLCQDNFMVLKADIAKKNELAAALQKIVTRLGKLSILVNNAAIDAPPDAAAIDSGPFETYPEESWDLMMKVNLKGVFLCCQVFGGYMAEHGGGSIINISSIYGMLSPDQRLYEYKDKPFFKPAAYSVSKAGVLNLTRYLATYWAGKNVRVNTLTLAGVFNDQDKRFLKKYNEKVPLGRMADASDYNGAMLFLASEASNYMTGANLVIDGGFSAW
jgi:NAD(P)-dependent dehydrogenase (short-subunit alcohol dehydrogenase family)